MGDDGLRLEWIALVSPADDPPTRAADDVGLPTPCVWLRWVDSESYVDEDESWVDRTDVEVWAARPTTETVSCGMILFEDDDHVTLVLSLTARQASGNVKVPKRCIVERHDLEWAPSGDLE